MGAFSIKDEHFNAGDSAYYNLNADTITVEILSVSGNRIVGKSSSGNEEVWTLRSHYESNDSDHIVVEWRLKGHKFGKLHHGVVEPYHDPCF